MVGLDFHYKQQAMWNYSEVYSTEIYTSRAKSIIESHDKSTVGALSYMFHSLLINNAVVTALEFRI